MGRINVLLIFLLPMGILGQDAVLFDDFRQHNLTHLNSSLFNPTFSIDRNSPRSATLWSRWQWQSPDSDPTTLLFNYSQLIGQQFSGGLAFFQNNTDLYQNTGGVLNFAFGIPMGENTDLFFGSNIVLFERSFNTTGAALGLENTFVGQLSPGMRFRVANFNLGVTLENALNYNFSESGSDGDNRIVTGSLSYDIAAGQAFVRTQPYLRSIPDQDFQYGLNALYRHPNFWIQAGYNNYYGFSGGAGVTVLQKFSVGALVEFAEDNLPTPSGESFELLVSYNFGKQEYKADRPSSEPGLELENEEPGAATERRAEAQRDSINRIREARKLAQIQRQRLDSLQKVREKLITGLREKADQDSIAQAEEAQRNVVLPNEKYEEVASIDGLVPGYYLIANVFGTKRYFEKFMRTLKSSGLKPKSFYRNSNKYTYVYLARYDSLKGARAARNSGFDGKYKDDLWIFRVKNR